MAPSPRKGNFVLSESNVDDLISAWPHGNMRDRNANRGLDQVQIHASFLRKVFQLANLRDRNRPPGNLLEHGLGLRQPVVDREVVRLLTVNPVASTDPNRVDA